MRPYFFSMLFLLCALVGNSQSDSSKHKTNNEQRDLVNLKVDFTNMINPEDPSLLFSVEYFLKPYFSINHEAGYVVSIQTEDLGESFEGFKTRHEFRWFFNENDQKQTRLYTSVNFQYRYLAMKDRYTLGYECDDFNGNCEYLKNFIGKVKTDRYVVQVRMGIQSHLSNRVICEFDAGLGYQKYDVRRSSLNGGRLMEPNRFFDEDDFATKPYVSVSGKLGFVLFKKSG